jgi:hypothetical protein
MKWGDIAVKLKVDELNVSTAKRIELCSAAQVKNAHGTEFR